MTLELEVHPGPEAAARRVAALVIDRADATPGPFTLALSKAPAVLLGTLAEGLPWERVTVYQVDERIAPRGTPDRNLTALLAALPHDRVRPMPVDDAEPDAAAERYAAELPLTLELVHLGLGADGHTASLVPGDPVLDVRDRAVAVTGEYEGCRRMTLTYPALDAARELVWLVTGREKADALARFLDHDRSIPASRISSSRQLVVADVEAVPVP